MMINRLKIHRPLNLLTKLNFSLVALSLVLTSSCVRSQDAAVRHLEASGEVGRKSFKLEAEKTWQLNLPYGSRFDASGLLIYDGQLLTINDRSSELWEIQFTNNPTCSLRATGWFTYTQILHASGKSNPGHDCEAIAHDANGNLYISEEKDRAIFRLDPKTKSVTKLTIDWSPVRKYFSKLDDNASFEGLAIGNGKMYVANERSDPRIIVVDLATLKVEDNFAVDASGFAFGGPHYSDLSWYDDHLFVLDRNHRAVLEVNPKTKRVVAEYGFGEMELMPELAYKTVYPTGTMEGLAVDANYIWLVTDNNGKGRYKYPDDTRPILFRCNRPQRSKP